MADSEPPHTPMIRLPRRISSSSGLALPPERPAPCVLDLLGQANPRAHGDSESAI
jgi:hypothetical protein